MNRIAYFNITYKCNNNCKYCVSYNVKNKLDIEVQVDDIKFISDTFGLKENDQFTISGGEPTMSPYLYDIINYCYSITPHIILYSNGRKLKNLPITTLKKIERIIVPLYGNESFHDMHMGIKGAFSESIDSILKIIDLDPNKIDLKILLDEEGNIESLFNTDIWGQLLKTKYFSITRLLNNDLPPKNPRKIALLASNIIQNLWDENKNIRYYDIPFCYLKSEIKKAILSANLKKLDYNYNVICGSAFHRYKIFRFNGKTNLYNECNKCDYQIYCCMIMRNYFSPLISGNQLIISTE